MRLGVLRRVAVIAGLAFLALPAHAAWAGSGPSYTATSTSSPPTIDGNLTDSAWASATRYSLTFGNFPATVRFLRDGTNLYVGMTVNDPGASASPSLSTYFDNADNNATDVGDDAWLADVVGGEDFFSSDTTGSAYTNDASFGGTNDTTAAYTVSSGSSVSFELKHPLCSSDTSHDVCFSPSNPLAGVDFQYEPGVTPGVFYDAPGTRTDQSTWPNLSPGVFVSASDTTPPTVSITSPTAGSDLQGPVTASADVSDAGGVASVDFKEFDGATQQFYDIGTATTAPYSVSFDSNAVPNCEHMDCTIYAIATDTSGNSTTVGVGVGIANPIVVGTTIDDTSGASCSLREAIASANNNDAEGGCKNGLSTITDTVDVPAGRYGLTVGQLLVASDMNIVGAGARTTEIDGGATGQRVLEISGVNANAPGVDVTIGGVTIEGGSTHNPGPETNAGVGGGIWVDSGSTVTLQDSAVRGNEADLSGGGIDNDGSLTILRSTIENNNTPGFGAGIDDFGPSLTITNSTIMGNFAQGDGGGLDLGADATLTNDTIANNEAAFFTSSGDGGGIVLAAGVTVSATNTLLSGNTEQRSGLLVHSNCSTTIASQGHNLADDTTCGLTATGDQQSVNPGLAPVDTSGPTDVLPLGFGSPAIDAGSTACPATDQRGIARPQGAQCDIGAYELAVATVNTSGDPEVTSCGTAAGVCSLRAAVRAVNSAGRGVIDFDIPGVTSAPTITLNSPLNPITAPVLIDGHTQPNTPVNTPGVTIVPGPNFASGALIDLASGSGGSTVHGLAFGGNATLTAGTDAIDVESDNNAITGNWIGVAADSSALGLGYYGIDVTGNDNTIGGGRTSDPNVITGGVQDAISVESPSDTPTVGNVIQGNLLGLDPDGTPTSGRGNGISLSDAQGTVIGSYVGPGGLSDVQAQLGNVISGMGDGIDVGGGSTGTIVAGNFIGVDRSGAATSPNADGVVVFGSSGNQIGPGNTIAHSAKDGVAVEGGDFGSATGDRIVANSIFDSGNLGIDLVQGANNAISAPVITSVSGSTVSGTFTSTSADPVFIELFVNPSCNAPYASGAGQTFINFISGSPGSWTATIPGLANGEGVTVTATDELTNDTSEFSNCATVGAGNATGASASFSADPSVQMSGTVPIADIPLDAFDPQPPGAPPITTHGLQLNQTQLNQTQLNQTQLNQTQLNQTQLNQTQLNQTQLNQTPLASQLNQTQLNQTQLNQTQLNQTQLNQTQLNQTQLNQTTLNQLPLDPSRFPDGWTGLLQQTTLADEPLQTVTLHDVMSLTSPPNPADVVSRIQSLTFADLEIQASSLADLTVGALVLGSADVNQLGNLTAPIESQLSAWCLSFVPSGDPQGFCTGADPGMGDLTLIQLTLMGAPVQDLQLNQTQLNQTQLNQTQLNQTPVGFGQFSTSASGIVGMQLDKLDLTTGIGSLEVSLLPTTVLDGLFDCSNLLSFDCLTGTLAQAQAAGAIKDSTTVGDLDVGDFFKGVTVAQLLQSVLGPNSAYKDVADFGDLVGLFLQSADVNWEALKPDLLAIFDPDRHQMSMSAGFTIDGTGSPAADVKIDLPPGFDLVPGSTTLSKDDSGSTALADPTITNTGSGYELDWQLDAVDAGTSYSLSFDALAGTTVGPTQATESVTAGGHTATSTAAFSVTDSFPGDDTAGAATPIDTTAGHETVDMSTLSKPGAVDYYTFPMPAAGTRVQIHLTNLPADYDLALYSPRTTSVRTGATDAPPLQDGIVPDQQVNLNGGTSGQLTPTGLEDVPDPGIPLVQLSDNRHQDDEDVGMVSPGGAGSITVAVFGYNGAFSPKAYTLRVREAAPQAPESCPARSFPDAGQGTTPDSLPALSSLPANLNTIILVDEKRLGDTYGSADEATAVAALNRLAGDGSLGVSGVVVPVETIPGVQTLYDNWDGLNTGSPANSNPCDPNAANAVANAIADEVAAIKVARPTVQYVVFGGGDDQIPFFRLPDLSLIANESGFAGQFGANEYQGSLAAGDLLSDDPYLDTHPVPASGQQLFPPNLAGGRLVETAQDIANAVTAFENAPTPGALQSSTGFVSGYDFVADGSQAVADNLTKLGVSVQTLDTPLSATSDWGMGALIAAAFPTGGAPADINSWNGHYDNYRTQMANGDILSTSDLPSGLDNGVFFTMGCHAGFQTTDAVVGSSVLDWPQYFSEHDTGFVGNTGFGLGDTDSVAFSEQLMADLAGQLGGSVTLGQALLQAKQQYYLSRVAFSNYDEKALSEAELYGLPMYGVGRAPSTLMGTTGTPSDPVAGTSQSTSPANGSLSPFTSGVQSASFSAHPTFTFQQGANGDSYTNAGQVQAPNYRPLQPFVSVPAERTGSGLVAHGVVIDGLTSEDHTTNPSNPLLPWVPDNVRPTLNSSATEPPPTFTDEAWPEKIPTLVSLGEDQSLNLITGQFFTESGSGTTGVERLWTGIDGRVTYSDSHDFTPPTIDSIDAFLSNGVVSFTGSFSDLDQNGNAGAVAFAQVVYDDGTGHWNALPLQFDSTSKTWSGGAPFSGSAVQFFVEACDTAGNCGYSSNKGRYFDALPLPAGSSGSLTITPSRGPDAGTPVTWYTSGLTVTASGDEPQISVDGGAFASGASPIAIAGDGAHVVQALDSDGNKATAVYLIDSTGPVVTHTVSPAAPDGNSGWYVTSPTVTFDCTDNLSGVKSCLVDGASGDSATLGEGPSQGASATGVDNAGNSGHGSVSGIKVDVTPPALPTFTGIKAQLYAINDLPPQSAIGCTTSDATSGPAGCVVTGYSSAIGTHILTGTATDNAGNTSVDTLTYTVGFQAGDILPPVTAPSGDQTNPSATDLQVFKIKSTVPLKFQFYLDAARTTPMTTPPAGSTAILTVVKHDGATDSTVDATLVTASADTGNQFRWSTGQYVYNMATKQLTSGTYYCTITLVSSVGSVIGVSAPQYFQLRS